MNQRERDWGDTCKVAGKPLSCHHCGHQGFVRETTQLNDRLLSFLDLDFFGRTASVLVCARCGFLHWFLPKLANIEMGERFSFLKHTPPPLLDEEGDEADEGPGEPRKCLSCGAGIPVERVFCGECAGSYR